VGVVVVVDVDVAVAVAVVVEDDVVDEEVVVWVEDRADAERAAFDPDVARPDVEVGAVDVSEVEVAGVSGRAGVAACEADAPAVKAMKAPVPSSEKPLSAAVARRARRKPGRGRRREAG
jgi:hypothetical protein